MILSKKALMLAQVKEYVADTEENKLVNDYLKAFLKLSKEKAELLYDEIRAINSPKIKEDHIIKIVDLLPKDAEDLNKIFMDVGLTEEESNAILAIVKKY